uniref:Dual specificity phosphatase 22a n=1 Tax=Eptatretus burgeri TaxID=7764 RepID=A0A8C4WWI7_EPTBU
MGNGMTKIIDGLYLGNYHDSKDREQLSRNNITHIVSIHDYPKPELADMKYLCLNASDCSSQDLTRYFKDCVKFIHECRLKGGGCLVHCMAGISRSTTVVLVYLMTVTELGFADTLAAVRTVRTHACPNCGFQEQLQHFERYSLKDMRLWLRLEFGHNPFNDHIAVGALLISSARAIRHDTSRVGTRSASYVDTYTQRSGYSNSRLK